MPQRVRRHDAFRILARTSATTSARDFMAVISRRQVGLAISIFHGDPPTVKHLRFAPDHQNLDLSFLKPLPCNMTRNWLCHGGSIITVGAPGRGIARGRFWQLYPSAWLP